MLITAHRTRNNMYKDKLKASTNKFLETYVFPCSKFKTITSENADEIVEFIVDTYVSPLVNDQEEGKHIDEGLLKKADNAIDDICNN